MYSDCITTSEYKKMKSLRKIFYRISINPILTILIMPPFIFLLSTELHSIPLAPGYVRGWAST